MKSESRKIIEAARNVLKAHGFFVDNLWHAQDIHFICEQHDVPKISDEECAMVFTIANEQFDGDNGLCWPQLEKALNVFLKRKTVLANLYQDELPHTPTNAQNSQ